MNEYTIQITIINMDMALNNPTNCNRDMVIQLYAENDKMAYHNAIDTAYNNVSENESIYDIKILYVI